MVFLVCSPLLRFFDKSSHHWQSSSKIRNFFFHVPMWFGQMGLLTLSLAYSIAYLRTQNIKYDIYAAEFAKTGIIFGNFRISNWRYLGKIYLGRILEQ